MKYNILDEFKSRFNDPQIYVKSPGRANIIGEHTDYNHGLVLPFAIKQCIHMYMGQNDNGILRIFAFDINENVEINLSHITFQNTGWTRYFVNSLVACGYNKTIGIDVVFGGDLPQGGGVSSSSALTCGFLAGLNALFDMKYNQGQLINLASQAENGIGLNGGIMDQTVIFKGKKDKALKIDFLNFSVSEYDMPIKDYSFYLFNSGQKHNLVNTEYNKRRATCNEALNCIKLKKPGTRTLRDVSLKDIDSLLDNIVFKKRCIHVIEENERVSLATIALEEKNYEQLGLLILESHRSLSENYEVSTPQINYLVDRSQNINNLLGSRIMGGGFGGCTINFVKGTISNEDIKKLSVDYKANTGFDLNTYEVSANDGLEVYNAGDK